MAVAARGTLTTMTRAPATATSHPVRLTASAAEGQHVPVAVQVDALEVDVGNGLVGGAAGGPLVDPLVGQAIQKVERARLAVAALRAEQPPRRPGPQHAAGRSG